MQQKRKIKEIAQLMKQVYLIDFGLAKQFKDSITQVHLANIKKHNKACNTIFCSRNQLLGDEFSRRDDIIMIIQSLIFMRDWKKPWIENQPQEPGEQDRIK